MTGEEKLRWTVFVTASFLLHAAALAWLDLTGADSGRLPSKLTVLLESRSEREGTGVREEPTSAIRSRDLFYRPPARVAEAKSLAKAEQESAVVGAATPPEPKRAPWRKTETASAPPAIVATVPAASENEFIESASRAASVADVAAAGPEPAPAATDSGAAEQQRQLLSLLHQAISRERRYPMLARRQRREGTTTVIFSLSPSGEMNAIGVDRSSGFSLLDTAAVSAVSRVAPFAPARLFLSDVTRFKVDVTFKLN